MTYLLDTDIAIYIIKRKSERLLRKLYAFKLEQIAISTITVAELELGAAKSQHPERNRLALTKFLIPFSLLDFNYSAARAYGRIRAALEARGTVIGPMDLLLAAQAVSHEYGLVTNNVREFRRVEGLRVENWAAA
jgi:tRNA(fMet)-specific endonuclease VapC